MNAQQIGELLKTLLKDNGYYIRPYEGEQSCCVIERLDQIKCIDNPAYDKDCTDNYCVYDFARHGTMDEPEYEIDPEMDNLLAKVFVEDYLKGGGFPVRSQIVQELLKKNSTSASYSYQCDTEMPQVSED